jgi:hypothetical protein
MILISRQYPRWISRKTLHPAIPVPNLDSIWVQLSIRKTYAEIERSQKDGIWHVHRMPRLLGLAPYVNETFKGFGCGRPPRKTAIESSHLQVPHPPPQGARPTPGINWRLVLR